MECGDATAMLDNEAMEQVVVPVTFDHERPDSERL